MSELKEQLVTLADEFQRAGGTSTIHHYQTRTDNVRLARWRGQSHSGRKEQKYYDKEKVFPWDGCSDTRVRLVDNLVGEMKDLLVTAFRRGTLRAGATEANDAESAQLLTTLLRYYRENLLQQELHEAASLLAVHFLFVDQLMCPILHFHQPSARMFSVFLLSTSAHLFSTRSACLPIEGAVTLVWSTDTNLPLLSSMKAI